MKLILTAALLLSVTGLVTLSAQTEEEHETLMKTAGDTLRSLRQTVKAKEYPAVAQAGHDLEDVFAKVEEFWAARNTNDAVGWSRDARSAAAEMASAADSGADPAAAFDKLSESCKLCHDAHRTKADDGSWQIK